MGAAAMSDDEDFEAEIGTLPERDQPYARRFWKRVREGDPRAERVMPQYEAGELRCREAIMIGGVAR